MNALREPTLLFLAADGAREERAEHAVHARLVAGARVGHAWLNVLAMKGMLAAPVPGPTSVGERRGIESGRFGFTVADVGSGGRLSRSGVNQGTSKATTFWIMVAFCSYDVNISPFKTTCCAPQRGASSAAVRLQ